MNTKHGLTRRDTLGLLGAAGLGLTLPAAAQADFPNRPLKIVLPFQAGGVVDVVARAIGRELELSMKQPVVIDNRPGGLFQVAVQTVSAAPADGYTLMFINSSMVAVQSIYKRFDLTHQFMPLTMIADAPAVIVVPANSPFKTLQEMVAYGRAHPGELSYGSMGIGTLEHIKALQFQEAAGFQAKGIPYKGAPDMINAIIAGDISYAQVNVLSAMQFVPSGRVRALAGVDSTRLKALPDLPILQEAGVKIPNSRAWSGFVILAGTPAPIAQRLFKELTAAMRAPALIKITAPVGIDIKTSQSPEEFRELIASEAAWMGAMAQKVKLDAN